MNGRVALLSVCLALSAAPLAAEAPVPPPAYPETRAEPLIEEIFGEQIADPYRWLEKDARSDPEVADWVARQNAASAGFLRQLPGRGWFAQRIAGLMDFERFGIPRKAGENYFYTRNSGLLNQPQLYVQAGLEGERRLLLDPNRWSRDGTAALATWEPSPDGTLLAYSVQDGGSDWRTIRVIEVASGRQLGEDIRWAKFSGIAWVGSQGLLYSRFPEPAPGEDLRAVNLNQAVWFHRIGTAQANDRLVFATPAHPERSHAARTTHDGRWAVITSSVGMEERHEIHLIDLDRRGSDRWRAIPLVTGLTHSWRLVEALEGRLHFLTDAGAPRQRILAAELGRRRPRWREVVAEAGDQISGASIVGQQLVVEYVRDAGTTAMVFDTLGRPVGRIALAGLGAAGGFRGTPADSETFYSFSSFNRPASVYRLDLASGESSIFAAPELTFDPERYEIEQRFYSSKDGTRVPIFIVRSKALAQDGRPAPTLLYGYGGFDVSLTPGFSATRMAWLEAGGVFALANIRGGGEFGNAWHEAGRRANKQNTFDDFIAAAEFLKAEGYTTSGGLAIEGRSNGGLLVGAVVNQRPGLFAAAHAAVGVMDMLRFDRFTAGRYWLDDYGDPAREADFRVLRAYSPYHNIRAGAGYPAMLVTTGDSDDRVVPGHSFKYAAALQAADPGGQPQLLRVEPRTGHGAGKPTDKLIAEGADVLAFLAHYTGLELPGTDVQKK